MVPLQDLDCGERIVCRPYRRANRWHNSGRCSQVYLTLRPPHPRFLPAKCPSTDTWPTSTLEALYHVCDVASSPNHCSRHPSPLPLQLPMLPFPPLLAYLYPRFHCHPWCIHRRLEWPQLVAKLSGHNSRKKGVHPRPS